MYMHNLVFKNLYNSGECVVLKHVTQLQRCSNIDVGLTCSSVIPRLKLSPERAHLIGLEAPSKGAASPTYPQRLSAIHVCAKLELLNSEVKNKTGRRV